MVPIVFHTGKAIWSKNRRLADMLAGPEAFKKFAPIWQPLFVDLAGMTPAELLQAAGEWLNTLAVVRADQESTSEFTAVLEQALRRLEDLADKDRGRWYDLVHFALQWAIYRRAPEERGDLVQLALASQTNATHQKEVRTVAQTIADALRDEGKVEGQLRQARDILRDLLEEKFGSLPQLLLQRINTSNDLGRLNLAIRCVSRMNAVDELQI